MDSGTGDVAADLSARLIAGRVVSHLPETSIDEAVVNSDGPAGSYRNIKLGDICDGPAPQVFYGTFGMPKAAGAVAEAFDGVIRGADEITTYGSTPRQNAGLSTVWRGAFAGTGR